MFASGTCLVTLQHCHHHTEDIGFPLQEVRGLLYTGPLARATDNVISCPTPKHSLVSACSCAAPESDIIHAVSCTTCGVCAPSDSGEGNDNHSGISESGEGVAPNAYHDERSPAPLDPVERI